MGSNKEWVTETLTADYSPSDWMLDEPNVNTLSESFTVTMPDFNFENPCDEELKSKYPALKQAWDHYQMVLKMCRAKEENED